MKSAHSTATATADVCDVRVTFLQCTSFLYMSDLLHSDTLHKCGVTACWLQLTAAVKCLSVKVVMLLTLVFKMYKILGKDVSISLLTYRQCFTI